MAESVVQLRCLCKHDHWGKKGKESLAAQLAAKTPGTDFQIDDNQYYSEMWMGTYPTVPSYVISTGETLQDYLKKHPEFIGKAVLDRAGPDIPFLPKILSMTKALPLQEHPDRKLAEQLHQRDPKKFGDPNHKPEIAVALSKFELFAGWKPLNDIQQLFGLKPLQRFVPGQHTHFNDETLRQICRSLLLAPDKVVAETIDQLGLLPEQAFGKYIYIPGLLDRLRKQYTEFDNGNLVAVLLMNFLTLGPGDAVFIPADGIHAYLSGDIVECMARSDNVLNTGFCPRAERDSVDLFMQALTFVPHDPEEVILPSQTSDKGMNGKTREYAPPISEFNMLATCLKPGESETVKSILGPSIMIVIKGSGKMRVPHKTFDIQEGYVYFVGQGVPLEFETETGLSVYRAYAE